MAQEQFVSFAAGDATPPRPRSGVVVLPWYLSLMPKPKPKTGEQGPRQLRAKIFRTGRSQAVRLPKELRFDPDQTEVSVRREGNRLILEPLDEWPDRFLEALESCPDFPKPPARTPLRKARDRFSR
jgi:antitoxin VapB